MPLLICPDHISPSVRLADILEQAILDQPNLTLGLATGRTSTAAYAELVARHHQNTELAFRQVTTFNTDEFVPLSANHPISARYLMNYQLFRHVDIKLENTYIPHGDTEDLQAECEAYEAMLAARGGLIWWCWVLVIMATSVLTNPVRASKAAPASSISPRQPWQP